MKKVGQIKKLIVPLIQTLCLSRFCSEMVFFSSYYTSKEDREIMNLKTLLRHIMKKKDNAKVI